MSNKANEEIKNLEKQLELLKQKQQLEIENEQLKDDIAYLRKSQQEKDELDDKVSTIMAKGCLFIVAGLIIIPIVFVMVFG